jgi:hypothetical protein
MDAVQLDSPWTVFPDQARAGIDACRLRWTKTSFGAAGLFKPVAHKPVRNPIEV